MTAVDGDYLILLTHSSRPVDFDECAYPVLRDRYANPDRLKNLPSFESLPHIDTRRHYKGGLSVLELSVSGGSARLRRANYLDPGFKIQHATLVDGRLVLCLEDALLLLNDPLAPFPEASPERIDDPWFAGLHTVFQSGKSRCVVSASAPDAVMEVDLETRSVTKRLRLPAEIYGENYKLDETTSLREHYIHNDVQVAHVNCAWPTSDGSIYVSSLVRGDIGVFDPVGNYRVLSRGDIGCHSARVTADGGTLYYADSCNGNLVLCDRGGTERRRIAMRTNWLHDVQHIDGDLFALCLSDRNLLVLFDVRRDAVVLDESFADLGGSLQFVSIHRGDH